MRGSNWEGRFEGILGSLAYGWAWEPDNPDRVLVVELTADDYPVAVARARLFDPELARRGAGRGEHAFAVHLPESILDAGARIRARIANTDRWLDGELQPAVEADTIPDARPPLEGRVQHDGGLLVRGQALDPLHPESPVVVTCHLEEREIASTRTRGPAGAFRVVLPSSLADGRTRDIRVEVAGRELAGSPLRLCTHALGPSALLHRLLDSSHGIDRSAAVETLDRILEEYQIRLPHCVKFADYLPWSHLKERTTPADSAANRLRLVVLAEAGDAAKALRDSLEAQTHWNWRSWIQTDGTEIYEDTRFAPLPRLPLSMDPLLEPDTDLVVAVERGLVPAPDALSRIAEAFLDPGVKALYTDSDRLDHRGHRTDPWLKPAWDYERFLGQDYLHGLFAVRADLVRGEILEHPDDLVGFAVERLLCSDSENKVHHLPRVLGHRLDQADTTTDRDQRRQRRLQHLLDALEPGVRLHTHPHGHGGLRRIHRPLTSRPKVSLIIPTRDRADLLEKCVSSIERYTHYRSLEILIVDNDSREPQTHNLLKQLTERGHRVLSCPGPFNYSALNNQAVSQVSGEVIGLLNNDLELPATSQHWLEEMLSLLLRPGVGAVGAKLLWPNGMVQHAGVVLGVGGLAAHAGPLWQEQEAGYYGRNQLTQTVEAVTAACLLTRRKDFMALGGLDESLFPVNFNDLDYCLRLGETGLRVLWTPFATFVHHESASRGQDRDMPEKQARAQWEMANLRRRWAQRLAYDRAYHPDLTLDPAAGPFGGLALVTGREPELR